jgi:hypothetical protein
VSRLDLVTSDTLKRRARLREAFAGRPPPELTDQQRLALLPRPSYTPPPERTPEKQTALAERFALMCAADRERVDSEAARCEAIWCRWESRWAEYQAGEDALAGELQSQEYYERQRDLRRATERHRKAVENRKRYLPKAPPTQHNPQPSEKDNWSQANSMTAGNSPRHVENHKPANMPTHRSGLPRLRTGALETHSSNLTISAATT